MWDAGVSVLCRTTGPSGRLTDLCAPSFLWGRAGRGASLRLDSAPTRFIRTFVPGEGFGDSAVSETHFRDL